MAALGHVDAVLNTSIHTCRMVHFAHHSYWIHAAR